MKRIISILLCLTLAFNIFGVMASALEDESNIFAEIADDADAMMASQVDVMGGISSGVNRLVKDLDTRLLAEQQVSFFSSFMTGAKTLSLGLSLVNGTVSFLKLIGIIEDPTAKKLNTIYECLLDVQETVHTIDKRTEDIQKSLIAQASTTTYNFRLDRYDSYRQSWNSFFSSGGSYDEIRRLMEAYQSEFNKKMIDYATAWQDGSENGIRVLYSADGLALSSGSNLSGPDTALPKQPSYSDDGYRVTSSITLPGSFIGVEDALIKGDTYIAILEAAVHDGVQKALSEKALIASDEAFYEKYEAMDEAGKVEFAERLGNDFLDAVSYDAAYETANMTYDVGSFASAVSSAFTTYCNTVLGANGVTSPLESGLCKLSLTHGFEGEVKGDAAAICGYLAEISIAYGEFTAFLTAMDKGTTTSKQEAVIDRCLKSAYYPVCYHDSFITGYDNYCYPLNALIEFHDVRFNATYTYKSGNPYEPKDAGWDILSDSINATSEKVKNIINNNLMISKQDMTLLYLYYESAAASNPELGNFNDYLDSIDLLPRKANPLIILRGTNTSLDGLADIDPADKEHSQVYLMSSPAPYDLMKRKVDEYRTKDKKWGETIQFYKSDTVYLKEGDMDYSKEGESTVFFHDQMKADVFDAGSQGISLESRLQNNATVAERAYTYYVLKSSHGAGKYVYVTFANPGSHLSYNYVSSGTNTIRMRSASYSMLSYSTQQIRGNGTTASVFGNGMWWIIGGGAVILTAIAVTAVCLTKKKRKKEKASEPMNENS